MNAGSFKEWFRSGLDPDSFPQVPSSGKTRARFLSDLAAWLWELPIEGIEKVMVSLPGQLGSQVEAAEFVEALEKAMVPGADPRKVVLLGELTLDFLLPAEEWEACADRSGKLIEIAERNGLKREVTVLLNYRGVCRYRLARYNQAREDLLESLRLAEEQGSKRRQSRARSNLGLVLKDMGLLEDAAGHFKAALKLAKEDNDSRVLLSCYLNIGNIYRELARWEEGRRALVSGIDLAGELGESLERTRGRLNLGVLVLEEGKDLRQAIQIFREVAIEAAEENAEQLEWTARSNLGLVLAMTGAFEESLKESELCADNAVKTGDPEALWRAHENMAKAFRGMGKVDRAEVEYRHALAVFGKLREGLTSDRDKSNFQRNLQDLQAEYVRYGLERRSPEIAFGRLAVSKGRAMVGGKDIDATEPSDPWMTEQTIVEGIQSALKRDSGSLLLDFFISRGVVSLFACDEKRVTVHELPISEREIRDLLRDFSTEVNLFIASREYRDAQKRKKSEMPPALRKLGAGILGPIRERLDEAEHLIMVPMGLIHHVPFLALEGPMGYLAETHRISVLPSSDLLLRSIPRDFVQPRKVLVLKGEAEGLAEMEAELSFLKDIFGELLSIADLSQVLQSGVKGLAETLSDFDVIHFSGHAEFDRSDPFSSALILSGGIRLDLSTLDTAAVNLKKTGLVMLAACETGKGEVLAGDELVGVARGFLRAGAESVVASLWKIPDDVATDFVVLFYSSWLQGHVPSEAVRHASLGILGPNEIHPYFFAPFQTYGPG
jgi:CHAT domain-containing protein/tetratricopeptide (TPR) repeat protein